MNFAHISNLILFSPLPAARWKSLRGEASFPRLVVVGVDVSLLNSTFNFWQRAAAARKRTKYKIL